MEWSELFAVPVFVFVNLGSPVCERIVSVLKDGIVVDCIHSQLYSIYNDLTVANSKNFSCCKYSRFLQTCRLRGFTFTFIVRIIVQFDRYNIPSEVVFFWEIIARFPSLLHSLADRTASPQITFANCLIKLLVASVRLGCDIGNNFCRDER
jgi:hypothetical protein